MRLLLAAVAAAAGLLGGGCAAGSAADGPPAIEYGRDTCTECRMIISDPRFASAYRTAAGTERIFDDLGDMARFGTQAGELDGATVWVHDYETEEWVEAGDAWFVTGTDVGTPMGHGVVAFASEGRARDFAARHGDVVDWDAVVAEVAEGSHGRGGGGTGPAPGAGADEGGTR